MVLIGSDTYEDLTAESFAKILEGLAADRPVRPGPQIDRQFAAPVGGPTTLTEPVPPRSDDDGASAALSDAAKPEALAAPRGGKPDDLKRISGVGPKIEGILNDLGIYHFDQIASWSSEQVDWVDDHLKFKGRIARERWIDQAKTLAAGGETDFSRRSDAGAT